MKAPIRINCGQVCPLTPAAFSASATNRTGIAVSTGPQVDAPHVAEERRIQGAADQPWHVKTAVQDGQHTHHPGHTKDAVVRQHQPDAGDSQDGLHQQAARHAVVAAQAVEHRGGVELPGDGEHRGERNHRQQGSACDGDFLQLHPAAQQFGAIHQQEDHQRQEQGHAVAVQVDAQAVDGLLVALGLHLHDVRTGDESDTGDGLHRVAQQAWRERCRSPRRQPMLKWPIMTGAP